MIRTMRLILVAAAAAFTLSACQKAAEPAPAAEAAAPAAEAAAAPAAATTGAGTPADAAKPEVCEGFVGAKCKNPDDFCKKAVGECQVADAQGVCTKKPEVCTKEYVPVCGCDGVTYGNACEADRAGASVLAPGACAKKKG